MERALEGMTKRMEQGTTLSDREVPLYVLLLHAYNSRELLNYFEAWEAVQSRLSTIEAKLNTQESLRHAVQGGRRIPPAGVGPPNQNPFER